MPLLTALFALVALIYASVGFGGGSTYTALLALWGVDHDLVPVISLLCNIVVVMGGCIRFARAGAYDWRRVLPLLIVSAPLAYWGGTVPLKQSTFYLILGSALLLSSIALLVRMENVKQRNVPQPILLIISALVGLLAGLSGIGGGIFMSPVLHLLRWAEARAIAAFASLYILVNSIFGIAGQLHKSGSAHIISSVHQFWPLIIAVLIGGTMGSHISIKYFTPTALRRATGILVGYAAIVLMYKGWGML